MMELLDFLPFICCLTLPLIFILILFVVSTFYFGKKRNGMPSVISITDISSLYLDASKESRSALFMNLPTSMKLDKENIQIALKDGPIEIPIKDIYAVTEVRNLTNKKAYFFYRRSDVPCYFVIRGLPTDDFSGIYQKILPGTVPIRKTTVDSALHFAEVLKWSFEGEKKKDLGTPLYSYSSQLLSLSNRVRVYYLETRHIGGRDGVKFIDRPLPLESNRRRWARPNSLTFDIFRDIINISVFGLGHDLTINKKDIKKILFSDGAPPYCHCITIVHNSITAPERISIYGTTQNFDAHLDELAEQLKKAGYAVVRV